jgi:S-DNA-T family DNA segregation ATPase FtsK/SpoIIIE
MMLEIIVGSVMAGLAGWSTIHKNFSMNDKEKIEKVFLRKRIFVEETGIDKKTRKRMPVLYRRTKKDHYTEYVYRLPLGIGFKDVEAHKGVFEDAVNNKNVFDEFTLDNLKQIKKVKWNKDIQKELSRIFIKKHDYKKTIQLEYDGMLKIKVFNKELEKEFDYKDEHLKSCKGYVIPVGVDHVSRKLIYHDFDKYQQMLIAGMTRYGKSIFLKNIVTTLAVNNEDHIRFYLIDLKGGLTFGRYESLSCVERVADSPESAWEVLKEVHDEMKEKMKEFRKKGYEGVADSGSKERVFIIIDEVGELSNDKGSDEDKEKLKDCKKYMSEFSRLGSGLGYYQILTTQYPTADIIDRQSKANSSAILTFPLKTEVNSRVILDESGAEKLPLIKGRAIYWTDKKMIVQTPFIKNNQIDKYLAPLKKKEVKLYEKPNFKGDQTRKDTLILR